MPAKQDIPDFVLIREEYIHGTTSLAKLAKKYGVSEPLLEKQAVRGKWSVLRREASAKVSREIAAKLQAQRMQQLEEWNRDDIALARQIRAQVKRHVTLLSRKKSKELSGITVEKLRSLSLSAESAQRIGRLALGASTENVEQPIVPGMAPTLTDFHDMLDLMGSTATPGLDFGTAPAP